MYAATLGSLYRVIDILLLGGEERQRTLFEPAAATGWFIYCGTTVNLATYTAEVAVQGAFYRFD